MSSMSTAADRDQDRRSALLVILATTVLLLAACGSPSPTAVHTVGSSSNSVWTAAFSSCMRDHGIHGFPDPAPGGRPFSVDPQQLGVSSSRYLAAEQSCNHLLPAGGTLQQQTQQCLLFGDCPQSLVQRLLTIGRTYARCMRSHGVPDFPDPSISAKGGRPVFDLTVAGVDVQSTDSQQFRAKDQTCRRLIKVPMPNLPYT
jgi:hypothetical protein